LKHKYWIAGLSVIFLVLVLAIAYGNFGLGEGKKAITGTAGGSLGSMIGVDTVKCHNAVAGIRCDDNFYPIYQEQCPDNYVPTCTNLCELDRLMVGDNRVCPSHCIDYCLPKDFASQLEKDRNQQF